MFLDNTDPKLYRFKKKKMAFLRCSDDLHFKYIFHKQSGSESGSEIKAKVGSGSEINNFGSTTLMMNSNNSIPGMSTSPKKVVWSKKGVKQ